MQESSSSGGGLLSSPIIPLVGMLLVMYFLLLRPRMQEQKRTEEESRTMRSSLKNGDKVITTGGIYGVITSVRDDTVQLRIADAVKIEVLRSAIVGRQPEPEKASETKT